MDRTIRVLAAVVVALVAAGVLALDPPHDFSQNPQECSGCHLLHNSLGSGLMSKSTNANLCDSCHGQLSDPDGTHFGFPWAPATNPQAVPGTSGYSHRWDASVTSRGANAPADANMASHLDGTNIACSSCHDQHNNQIGSNTGTQHVGGNTWAVVVGSSWAPNGPASPGTGKMKLNTVKATAAAKSYRVRVNAKDATQITYGISHDSGATWIVGGTVVPGGTTPTVVNLDDGSNVQVSFTSALSAYVVNDYWDFWAPVWCWAPNGPAAPGTGKMWLGTVTGTAASKSYRVRVLSKSGTQITYDVSHDGGKTWVAGGSVTPGGTTPTMANLDDGTNVRVAFVSPLASYLVNDYWNFWISYPMLQRANVDDALCEQCHQARVHSSARVEGNDATYPADGTNKFSHPVGEGLTKTYDGPILDANGVLQTAGDGNATNDMKLDSASKVRCTTCHFVHNADSNSLTVDTR